VDGLRKAFSLSSAATLTPALSGVNLHACCEEIVGICGSAGSGKSTLLRCIAGLMRADSGSILWFGARFHGGGCLPGLSYVPNLPDYYPFLTARDALEYHVDADIVGTGSRCAAIGHALRSVGLADYIDSPVGSLDVSQVAALAVAEALASSPRAIVIDGTFDSVKARDLIPICTALLTFAAAGGTILIASRCENVLRPVASRILRMDRGRIVGESTEPGEVAFETEMATRLVAERRH
jgi:ABC-type multidrug transport system ATPase subunit